MPTRSQTRDRGPFQADQLKDGDRYELSNGHPIYCHPSGRRHAGPTLAGGAVLETDPDVEWAGVDAGFTPEPGRCAPRMWPSRRPVTSRAGSAVSRRWR